MKKIILAAALSGAAFVATPALAQDAAAPTVTNAGPRVELVVGYDINKFFGEKEKGVLYGVGAGYDFAVTNTVALGVDVEATDSTAKAGDQINYIANGRDLYAGGRATFAVSDAANLYVKGGYTNLRLEGSDTFNTASENIDGWRLGVGTQYKVSGKAYVGGEYRYSSYEGGDLKRHQLALTVGTRF